MSCIRFVQSNCPRRLDNSAKAGFPTLLVASEFAPNGYGGGEALMGQLLTGFPPDKIYWWSCQESDRTTPGLHFQEHFYCRVPPKLFPYKKLTRQKSWLLEKIWAPYAAAHLRKTVAYLKPQQIWLMLHGVGILVFYRASLADANRTHVSIWDFANIRSRCALFGSNRAQRMMNMTEVLYKRANTCDVISDPMREEMARRTGRSDAIVVHSGLDPTEIQPMSSRETKALPFLEIAYAGTVIVSEVFRLFVTALENVRATLLRPVRLNFFGGRSDRDQPWFNPEWMTEEGYLETESFDRRIKQCTWGLVLMDLTDDDPRYNRFSFPNKFGTYLAAGLPLIVLAHRESTAARMMVDCKVGYFTDTTDIEQLSIFLQRVLAEPNPRQRFQEEILHCAKTEFNIARMRADIWKALGVSPSANETDVVANS